MSELNREQFERAERVFFGALKLPPGERTAFLDRSCADDPVVRAEVRALLEVAATQAPPSIRPLREMVNQAIAAGDAADSSEDVASWIGRQVGDYRITRLLGQGGMGIVFRAEQEEPVRRTVALKLIRSGMDSPEVISRFESERQALALMSHAGVARVFDAGTTDTGRHYFVMEYVDGRPITQYCDEQKLALRERLELFMRVCDAVQHAHHKGIIHRDLKASNVLVARDEHGGSPVPKVIDFGIAKAVEKALTAGAMQTMHTIPQLPIGTPEYMSPEQAVVGAAGHGAVDVDTRTDVYSLGVLLYELITGDLPFERERLRKTALDEMWRIIREDDPPRPSARLSSLKPDTSSVVAELRGAGDSTALTRRVRGELDWITMKAIEKERERRYGSPADLAADLARYLRHEPVTAGPPSAAYRAHKFVRRNRVPVVAAAAVIVALISGVIVSSWQAVRATRAERSARVERDRAEKLFGDVRKLAGQFMFDVDQAFQTAGPTKAREKLVTTSLEYLDSLAKGSSDPAVVRDLIDGYLRVGAVQFYPNTASLGDARGALASYRKALDLALSQEAPASTDPQPRIHVASCWMHLGTAQAELRQYDEALVSFNNARTIWESLSQTNAELGVLPSHNLALAHDMIADLSFNTERYPDWLTHLQAALKVRETALAGKPDDLVLRHAVAVSYEGLGSYYRRLRQRDEALTNYRRSLQIHEGVLSAEPGNPKYVRSVSLMQYKLATALLDSEEPAAGREAFPLLEQSARIRERVAQADRANVRAQMELSDVYKSLGDATTVDRRPGDALPWYEKSLRIREALAAAQPDVTDLRFGVATVCSSLATALRKLERYDDSCMRAGHSVEIYEKLWAENKVSPVGFGNLTLAYRNIGDCRLAQGRIDDAVQAFSRGRDAALAMNRMSPNDAKAVISLINVRRALGRSLAAGGRYDEARASFMDAMKGADELASLPGQTAAADKQRRDITTLLQNLDEHTSPPSTTGSTAR